MGEGHGRGAQADPAYGPPSPTGHWQVARVLTVASWTRLARTGGTGPIPSQTTQAQPTPKPTRPL